MPITSLRFSNVGPFDEVEFEFDEHVNVFTGPNNSGKSTTLVVLAEIVTYPFHFPEKLLRKHEAEFRIRTGKGSQAREMAWGFPLFTAERPSTEERLRLVADLLKESGYTSFVPAMRQSTDFRAKGPVVQEKSLAPDQATEKAATSLGLDAAATQELLRRKALIETSASLVTDEAVIQKIIEIDYRAYRQNNPYMRCIIDKIGQVASRITEGFPVEFLGVAEDEKGLFPQFRTPDGDVPLNVLSQGTQSLIQWLAHLLIGYAEYYDYPENLEEKPGVLIVDDIDAHLHPSWQRRIIPALTKHFPNLQIFCSTHSPLMLAGLKTGQVQLLKRDEERKVTVSRNQTDVVGWSVDEILRGFLDVPNPTDLETVSHIERLQELRRIEKPTAEEAEELAQLRQTVSRNLVAGPMAAQLEEFTTLLDEAKAELATQSRRKPSAEAKPGEIRGRASSTSPSRRTSG